MILLAIKIFEYVPIYPPGTRDGSDFLVFDDNKLCQGQ